MSRTLSGAFLALYSVFALALSPGNEPATDETSVVGTVIFIAIFLLLCIGYVYMTWRNEKKRKEQDGEAKKP